ncbi:MAG: Mu transposase C-terminal domain-containing protein [Verrucomicrobia bacterium]|nr:Mu transposase C-terminal domain-containing protein [Verrucomicrobiota bacterium]
MGAVHDGIQMFNIHYWDNVLSPLAGRSSKPFLIKYDPRNLSRVFYRDKDGHPCHPRIFLNQLQSSPLLDSRQNPYYFDHQMGTYPQEGYCVPATRQPCVQQDFLGGLRCCASVRKLAASIEKEYDDRGRESSLIGVRVRAECQCTHFP